MPKLIFIVGSPRSGTSYVGRALGQAEGAGYVEDTGLFSHVGARSDFHLYQQSMYPTGVFPYPWLYTKSRAVADRWTKQDRLSHALKQLLLMSGSASGAVETESDSALEPAAESDLLQLKEAMANEGNIFGFGKLAEAYFGEFARRQGCATVIEKTAEHLRFLPVMHQLFPQARVVLVRRDKRQCIASYFKTYGRGTSFHRLLPQRLKEAVLWRRLVQDEGRERWAAEQPWVTTVDFNVLMDRPAEELTKLADNLELNLPGEKLQPFLQGAAG